MKKRHAHLVAAALALVAALATGCKRDADSREHVGSQADPVTARYYCRTATLVATTTYTPDSISIETDGVTYAPSAQIPIPSVIGVTTGGSGQGTIDFTITWNDSTTDCTYAGDGAVSYVFQSCSDGHAAGDVLNTDEATLTVNDGDESNPANETVATLTLVEQGGCIPPADAGSPDSGAHDASTPDASKTADASTADAAKTGDASIADAATSEAAAPDASDAGAPDTGWTCSTNADCTDQLLCTQDVCKAGACIHTPAAKGTACNDGNLCDGSGACDGTGVCVLGPPPKIDTSNKCVSGTCDPQKGVVYTNVPSGTSCSDGNLCHGTQTCDGAGKCVATNVPVVQTSNLCVVSTCNPATGIVTNTPEPAGYACSVDRCLAPKNCDGQGSCASVPPPVIDTSNPCNKGTCVGDVGVVYTPASAGTACGDNSNPCVGAFACNASATCVQGPAPNLDDGNACTIDACTPATGITHTPVPMNKDNPCSIGSCDPVKGVSYAPAPLGTACPDGNACTGAKTCDGNGACRAGQPPVVTDGNPCTIDWCDAALGVEHAPAPSGTSCSDGNACNGMELCDGKGACAAGTPPTINSGNACTTDACDPLLGVTHTPVASPACIASEATWLAASVGRPSPRDGAMLTYDPTSATTILFGGENAGAPLGDLWSFDGVSRTWTPSGVTGPSPRSGAAAAIDAHRSKLVVFGGSSGGLSSGAVLGDTWEYDLVARSWARPALGSGAAPSARAYASMAFDPTQNRVVLVGGSSPLGPQAADGPWTWDGSAWTLQPTTGAAAPQPRFGASLAWLPSRARMVLFGGASTASPNAGTALGDTWELDTSAWAWSASVAAGSGPPARTAQAMSLDAARGCLVLFGGTSSSTALNLADTWEYTGTWTQRTTTSAPPARAGHALVFDAGRSKTLLFGGLSYSATATTTPGLDDTWEYDGPSGSWSPAAASVTPAALHTGAVFDASRNVLVARGDEPVPQMWEADGASLRFSSIDPFAGTDDFGAAVRGAFGADVGPQPMTYVASRARTMLVTMGGGAAYYPVAAAPTPVGTWEWDGTEWTERVCGGAPLAIGQATLAYDTARDRVLLYGGQVGQGLPTSGTSGAVWELDPNGCTWASGATGPARVNALAAWDSDRARLVVFGGATAPGSGAAFVTDTWELDTAGRVWTQRATVGPSARSGAAMTYDARRKKVVLYGGSPTVGSSAAPTSEVWEYDGGAGAWSQVTPAAGAAPTGRVNASLVYDPARAASVLVGGTDASGYRFDSWQWDGVAFTRLRTGAAPVARSGADAAWSPTGKSAILFGGVRGDGERAFLRDTWFWRDGDWARLGADRPEPVAYYAATTNLDGALPAARAGHSLAISSDGHVLLFGGEGDEGLLGDTWTLAPSSLTWTFAFDYPPSPRTDGSLVAIDTGFLFFGGLSASGPQSDVWKVDVNGNWQILSAYGPSARSAQGMAYDPSRNVVVLFGGLGPAGPLGDTWELNVATSTWTARTPSSPPPARFGHRLVFDSARSVVVLVGGMGATPGTSSSDTWEYAGATGQWTLREPAASPPPRAGLAAFFDPSLAAPVAFGGLAHRDSATALTCSDTWTFTRGASADAEPPRYPNGAHCGSGNDCATGQCVDGICCESACGSQCAACNVPGSEGRCVAVSGAPAGNRLPCASVTACPLACDGSDVSACHSQAGAWCGAGTCSSGESQGLSRCDNAGVCAPGRPHYCAPSACSGASCGCTVDSDCDDPTYFCGNGACRPFARLSSFSLSTTRPTAWSSFTLTATSTGTVAPVFYFSYAAPSPGSPSYAWACGGAATCSGALPPGVWIVSVQVKDSASPHVSDDARQLTVSTQ